MPTATDTNSDAPTQIAHQAKAPYQRGDYAAAERLCRLLLAEQPRNFDGLNLLGIIAAQTQRTALTIDFFSNAVLANPHYAAAHANLGLALQCHNRLEKELCSYENASKLKLNLVLNAILPALLTVGNKTPNNSDSNSTPESKPRSRAETQTPGSLSVPPKRKSSRVDL